MVEHHGNHSPEVSVVVPVYNVEQYLAECLDSVLEQSGVDLEVVCIDDCGTDSSCEILKECQARDSRIRIISHAENRGLSAARNTGIDNAKGEFVVFLDSDDLLNPDKLAVQVAAIRRDQADMVYFHTDLLWERFPLDPSPSVSSNPPEFVLFSQELRKTNLLNYPALLHAASSWSYIYSRDFLNRHAIRYDEHLKRWEDRAFWTRVARLAGTVSIVPVSARKYRQRTESITKGSQDPEHLWMMLRQLNIVLDEFELFRATNADHDTHTHTMYLHSYVAFRVTGWFLNAVKNLEDVAISEALLRGAVDLFGRLEWASIDLHSVKNFTRRLQIDVERTALLSGLLRRGRVRQAAQFLETGRTPEQYLAEAEESFAGAYPLSRKRFMEPEYPAAKDESQASPVSASDAWMSDMDVVIHIGFRKTGTTYVQTAFDLNRHLLLENGILFPNAGLDRTATRGGRPGACAGHLGFIELVRRQEERWDLWQEVFREIGNHDVRAIFISAENFLHEYHTVDLHKMRRAFSGFRRVSFIVSLRRPDAWIQSLYKELVCGGWRGEARTFAAFLEDNWRQMDYADRLGPWFDEFGQVAFDAISVDLHGENLDSIRAMLGILRRRTGCGPTGNELDGWELPSELGSYASPKAELVEAVRLLNVAKKPSSAYRRELSWLIGKWSNVDDLYDGPLLDADLRTRIEDGIRTRYMTLLDQLGVDRSPVEIWPDAAGDSACHTEPAPAITVRSAIMEDVIRIISKLPGDDPVHDFYRKFYRKGLPKAAKPKEPTIPTSERLLAQLILKPIVALWNIASRDTKERLRRRAKAAFGDGYVDRMVKIARRNSGEATGR